MAEVEEKHTKGILRKRVGGVSVRSMIWNCMKKVSVFNVLYVTTNVHVHLFMSVVKTGLSSLINTPGFKKQGSVYLLITFY